MSNRKIEMTCRDCGSRDVRRDASVSWNITAQSWEVVAILDSADCEECETETKIIERDAETGERI